VVDGRVRAFTLLLDHLTAEAEQAAERSVRLHQISETASIVASPAKSSATPCGPSGINQLWPRITADALVDEC